MTEADFRLKTCTSTKTALIRAKIDLEQWILSQIVGLVIVYPNLVSLCRSVDRLTGYWRFPEASRAVQNATLPEYSEFTHFIWSMLTKTAPNWRVVVLFDLRLTVFCIPNPSLVSLFEPVDWLLAFSQGWSDRAEVICQKQIQPVEWGSLAVLYCLESVWHAFPSDGPLKRTRNSLKPRTVCQGEMLRRNKLSTEHFPTTWNEVAPWRIVLFLMWRTPLRHRYRKEKKYILGKRQQPTNRSIGSKSETRFGFGIQKTVNLRSNSSTTLH